MKTGIGFVAFSVAIFFTALTEGCDCNGCGCGTSTTNNNGFVESPTYGFLPSCKMILDADEDAPSGVYDMLLSNGKFIQVYCEMGLNGGGYTFLNPQSIPYITSQRLDAWFTDRTSFLMRVRKTNGTQPYAVLTQLSDYASVPLKLGLNDYGGYANPVNLNVIGKPYLYHGFLLPVNNDTKGALRGLNVNGVRHSFINSDNNPSSQFTLYTNFKERQPSYYSVLLPLCYSIFSDFKPNPSSRVMPETYFMFGETHWGGAGCYTQSNQQLDITSWAIGFR